MRDILFRGKRKKDGKWVYGNYAVTDNNGKQHFVLKNKAFEFEVDPKTVGQYTGLTDKNGKKIFEGDILRVAYHPEQDVIIEWSDGCFGFRRANKPKDRVYSTVRYMQNAMSRLKIIGNIYDNPELLEVEE